MSESSIEDRVKKIVCDQMGTTPDKISALVDDLQSSFPGIGLTFIDQNQLPSV